MLHALRRNATRERRGRIATSGAVLAALAALAVIAPGASQGRGTIYDPGDIIVADSVHNAIKAVDPVTGAATPLSSGGFFVFPSDVTFAGDGDILVVDRDAFSGEGGVIRVDSLTGVQTKVSNNAISNAAGGKKLFKNPIALDRKGGSVYVPDFHRPQKVIKVNIDTGKQSLVTEGQKLHSPSDIVADDLAKPLVTSIGSDSAELIEVNPNSGKQSIVSENGKFDAPSAMALLGSNSVLVVDPGAGPGGSGAIFKVNLDNGKQKTLVEGGSFINPVGIALIDNNTVAVSDFGTPQLPLGGQIYRVDLDTGNQTLLNGSDFSNPLGIDIAP
jgi:hypothetical protein